MVPSDVARCADWAGSCQYGPYCQRTAPLPEGAVATHALFNAARLANGGVCEHFLRVEPTFCEADE